MSITVLNYHDQALVEQVNTMAAERAKATAEAAAKTASSSDFSAVLNETSQTYATTQNTSSGIRCPEDLNTIFEDAAAAYGVSVNLLKSIAKAESGFNASAVSHAGAVGIMQLMPATAASLGVSNSYDPRENIMGGAKLISQLLVKYNGNTSLALAAYNAGSGNVDKYGGIPPFTETQNYVKKVLAYLNTDITLPSLTSPLSNTAESNLDKAADALKSYITTHNISKSSLELAAALIKLSQAQNSVSSTENTAEISVGTNTGVSADAAESTPVNTEIQTGTADTGAPAGNTAAAGGTDTDTAGSESEDAAATPDTDASTAIAGGISGQPVQNPDSADVPSANDAADKIPVTDTSAEHSGDSSDSEEGTEDSSSIIQTPLENGTDSSFTVSQSEENEIS